MSKAEELIYEIICDIENGDTTIEKIYQKLIEYTGIIREVENE